MIGSMTGLTVWTCLLIGGSAPQPIVLDIDAMTASDSGVSQVVRVKTATDWTAAAIVIELDTGSMVTSLSLESDDVQAAQQMTLPTDAVPTGPKGYGRPIRIAGACDDDLGGDTPRFDQQRLDLCWYNQTTDDVGWGVLGQFTFTPDAVGRWTLAVTQAGDKNRHAFGGYVIHGRMVTDNTNP